MAGQIPLVSVRTPREGETIYVPDLARDVNPVIGVTFNNCVLVGPAVVAFLDRTILNEPEFRIAGDDKEESLWEVQPGTFRVGIIAFQDCVFNDCAFEGVGYAGTKAALDKFRRVP